MYINATSYSDLSTLQRCARKYRYRVMDGLEPAYTPRPLQVGTIFHRLLAGLYSNNLEAVEQELSTEVHQWMGDWDHHQQALEAYNEAVELFYRYQNYWKEDEQWEVLHVEEEFYATVDGHTIRLTPDLIIRDKEGQVWIVDHKTTSSYSDTRREPDLQTYLYFEAVSAVYPECAGFMYNNCRKKAPTLPALTKDRTRIADVKRIDTTYELLRDFMEDHTYLYNRDDHVIRLAELRAQNKFFWRDWLPLTTNQEILDDIRGLLNYERFVRETGSYSRSFQHGGGYLDCGNCQYATLCTVELTGGNVQLAISQEYQHRKER